MEILMAEHAGFCFGVKRAVEMVEEAAREHPVICWGPLIHNSQEIERLRSLGVQTCEDEEAGKNFVTQGEERVLIRTHGVGPEKYNWLRERGQPFLDATCPYVKKAQRLAAEAVEEGYQVIILGDGEHPEVKALQAWTGNQALVVPSWNRLETEKLADKVAVLAQTTEKEEKYRDLVSYLKERVSQVREMPTICQATQERQQAAAALAAQVDVMIIVGGKHSSNTRKLWELCKVIQPSSYLIESRHDLEWDWLRNAQRIGITAGASTPAWIIKEVIDKMEEMKETMANESEREINLDEQFDFHKIQAGEVVKGIVVKVTGDEVLVDIGGKSEGIIPAGELSHRRVDPREFVSVGQEISVEVLKEDKEGNFILSHKRAVTDEALNKLEQSKDKGEVIKAPVIEVVKGGLLVDVGIRGFVPASQVERGFVEDLSQYLHQELKLVVLELDRNSKKAVLSQKKVLEKEYNKQREALWENLEEGQTKKGVVKRLTNFGAFVDIGGADGLLHVSEMGWGRINHPSEVVKEGDEIEVFVLKADKQAGKISLSLKQLLKSPWELAQEKFQAGMVVPGKVMRLAPFGAFIELEPGIEGLAHISQLSPKRVNRVEDVLSVGQQVDVKILEIDSEKKRISLSLKEVVTDAEKSEIDQYLEQQPQEEGITIGDMVKENPEKEEE